MNVASLELSKELYELSGWGLDLMAVGESFVDLTPDNVEWSDSGVPLYDLGYLLRKLPDYVQLNKLKLFDAGRDEARVQYEATDEADIDDEFRADTPEDAACKLAIELFKQDVLKEEVK